MPTRPWSRSSTCPTSPTPWSVACWEPGADKAALIRTTYDGRPGHPVVIGREHWFGVRAAAVGDRGARDYLANHALVEVECGDLATGDDVDSWQV